VFWGFEISDNDSNSSPENVRINRKTA